MKWQKIWQCYTLIEDCSGILILRYEHLKFGNFCNCQKRNGELRLGLCCRNWVSSSHGVLLQSWPNTRNYFTIKYPNNIKVYVFVMCKSKGTIMSFMKIEHCWEFDPIWPFNDLLNKSPQPWVWNNRKLYIFGNFKHFENWLLFDPHVTPTGKGSNYPTYCQNSFWPVTLKLLITHFTRMALEYFFHYSIQLQNMFAITYVAITSNKSEGNGEWHHFLYRP